MDETKNENQGTTETRVLPAQSSSKKWIIIAVIVFVALFLMGRMFSPERMVERVIEQGIGGDVDIDRDGTMEFTGDDGQNISMRAGENVSLPPGWPSSVPIMPGATITYALSANTNESPVYNVTYTTNTPMNSVAEYYSRELASAGWTIEMNLAMGEATMLTATNEQEEGVLINIALGEKETTVAISVETK